MDEKTRKVFVIHRLIGTIPCSLPKTESGYKEAMKDAQGMLERDGDGNIVYEVVDYSHRVREIRELIDRDYGFNDPEFDAVMDKVRAILDSVEGKTNKPRAMAKAGKALADMSLIRAFESIQGNEPLWVDEERHCVSPDYIIFCHEEFGDPIPPTTREWLKKDFGIEV